ncbi:hypothetical protein JTB14_026648 [Gonioctena quinquepunctata]|nr:hypothetical protein JTB14_026648 [Gonioctena quinquepunctata]
MPRHYQKKFGPRGKKNYNEKFLQRAVTMVKQKKMSTRAAAEQFAIPYSTINDHYHGRHLLKYGRPSALDENEEKMLAEGLQLCAKWGSPLKPIDIKHIVRQYLTKRRVTEPRFEHNLPGTDWFNGFMKQNSTLTIELAENTKRVRAALSYELVADYFRNSKNVMKDIPCSNIINYDETNFVDDPGAVKVVSKKGTKHAHRAIDSTKTSTTVMFAIAGDDTMLPPYIVYKEKHSYVGWTEGGIKVARYNRTLSGWFDATIFEDWFYSIILPHFEKLDGHKVLVENNLSSHVTLGIQECENNEVRFLLLPPNSTHLLQPLHVAYFRPLKAAWKKEAVESVGLKSQANSIAGFRACGIVPFNPDAVLKKIPRKAVDETLETSWTGALVDHLEQLRTDPTKTVKRRKKLNVPPGRSIGTSDLRQRRKASDSESEDEHGEANNKNISDIESGKESDLEVAESEKSFTEDYEIGESSTFFENLTEEQNALPEEQNFEVFIVNDYVSVKFKTNRRDRNFIAKIETISDEELTVNTIRKKTQTKMYFCVSANSGLINNYV